MTYGSKVSINEAEREILRFVQVLFSYFLLFYYWPDKAFSATACPHHIFLSGVFLQVIGEGKESRFNTFDQLR
jgi:hypothetical protein